MLTWDTLLYLVQPTFPLPTLPHPLPRSYIIPSHSLQLPVHLHTWVYPYTFITYIHIPHHTQ